MKLRTKFVALLMPLVMAPLLFLGNLGYTQLRESAEARLFDDVDSSMRVYQRMTEQKAQTVRSNAIVLAQSVVVTGVLDAAGTEDFAAALRDFDRIASAYQASYPDHHDLVVYDPDFELLARHSTAAADLATSGELESQIRSANGASSSILSSAASIALLVSTPVFDERMQLAGHFAVVASLEDLARTLQATGIGEEGYYLVTDANGRILFGHNDRAVAELPAPVEFGKLLESVDTGTYSEFEFGGDRHFVEGVTLLDDLMLFAVIPAAQVHAASHSLGLVIIAVTFVAIVLTAGALYLALHNIVLRPVRQIRAAIQQISDGNLDVSLDTGAPDEIGDLVTAFSDMSKRLQDSNDHVEYLAYHDSLTGLPNRSLFREHLKTAIAQARREGCKLAVLFVDLDDFKRVNDTLGHQVGDEILRRVSDSIASALREGDLISRISTDDSDHVIARIGGDEFIVLLRNVEDEYAPRTVARRLCKLMRQPFVVNSNELYVSASIGISMFPDDSDSADDLVRNADAAMYHAKELGKNNYQYFSQSMNEAAANRLQLETKLRKALDLNQFELYYQPKVDPKTYAIVGAEALIRWNDPETGMVPPDQFISVAEDTGLIVPIGEWVLNSACIQLKEWQNRALPPISVAVNVSAIQVARQDLGFIVARSLRNSGVKAKYLEVEITESALMGGGRRAINILEELRGLDVTVSLDDFGTGYSSLSYLRKFPIDNLKIDQSFFAEIDTDDSSRSIVAAIIAMSKTLNMTVTAEGVENEIQMDFLREHDCDFAQGYLISPPVTAREFEELLGEADGYARQSPKAAAR